MKKALLWQEKRFFKSGKKLVFPFTSGLRLAFTFNARLHVVFTPFYFGQNTRFLNFFLEAF